MSTAKAFLSTVLLLAVLGSLKAQDDQLYDFVRASISETQTLYKKRDRLINLKNKNSIKPLRKSPPFTDLSPLISVNGNHVDMKFLKLLAIQDTTRVRNMANHLGFKYQSTMRKTLIRGWVLIDIDKKVFKHLWKAQKKNYPQKKA